MADDASYRLRLESSADASHLTVAPVLWGPLHKAVRYEMVSTKASDSGRSTTRQSGQAVLGPDGRATLSKLRLGIGPTDRYAITVKVFDGTTVVAEQALSHPE